MEEKGFSTASNTHHETFVISHLQTTFKKEALEELQSLLKQKIAINTFDPADPIQNTPLHMAAENGQTEVVAFLLKLGAEPNKARNDEYGHTPLHVAAKNGHLQIVEVLLEFNADINKTEKFGMTALHHAIANNHFNIACTLVFHGADIYIPDSLGITPLERAILNKNQENIRLLKIYASLNFCIQEDDLNLLAKEVEKDFSLASSLFKNKKHLDQTIQQQVEIAITHILEKNQEVIEEHLKKFAISEHDIESYLEKARELLFQCLSVRVLNKISKPLNISSLKAPLLITDEIPSGNEMTNNPTLGSKFQINVQNGGS